MALNLNQQQLTQLRKLCARSEREQRLVPALLKIIYEKKWFKLFLPKSYKGLELTLPKALQYEEELAYVDGSLGWTVTLCAGANLFAGYIDHHKAQQIFSSPKVCLGGSGAVSGLAEETANGYIVNGHWKYATGAPHLTHFTANCRITRKGQPVCNEDGSPLVRSFFFRKEEVSVHADWNTMGLKATAGHSFSIKNLKVRADRSFEINENKPVLDQLIYRYPFLPFAEATIGVNTLGMTKHFFELAIATIKEKQHRLHLPVLEAVLIKIQKAQTEVAALSEKLYAEVDKSWDELKSSGAVTRPRAKRIGGLCRRLVLVCRKHVAAIYPACGLAATAQDAELNRAFRDIFTASQHGLLTFPRD
ncbi:acyl-CoA dehydrogenase [Niabella insulamsoli]|uniref:acyl-CoA dehydrogenase n=1 Tax=Niabella insulamsoli TaxID=3144874 RepID=UPI0031FD69C9